MKNNMKNVTTNNKETIGDFVKDHLTDNKDWVYLNLYQEQYLNEKDSELFDKLTLCTVGLNVSADIRKNGEVYVCDSNVIPYAGYKYNYPVVDVYKDLITKMTKDVEYYVKRIKEQFVKDKKFKMWDFNNAGFWNTLVLFGKDYGIEFEEGYDESIKARYIDFIGINDK